MNKSFTRLPHLGVIEISGPDAAAFLQAQLTCDISRLPETGCQPGAWCNPKGRVIASFLIVRRWERFMLILPHELIGSVKQGLTIFVLRSKVTITSLVDHYSCAGFTDIDSIVDIESMLSPQHTDKLIIIDWPDKTASRYLIAGPPDQIELVLDLLSRKGFAEESLQAWQLQDIRAGIPWLSSATSEQVLPQELNLDNTGGLSYNKGCYPGQEIVARLHFRGQLKRRLFGGYIDSETANPQPGTKLSKEDDTNSSGIIINSIRKSAKRVRSLAVLNIEDAASTQLHTPDGDIFHPFTATEESSTD